MLTSKLCFFFVFLFLRMSLYYSCSLRFGFLATLPVGPAAAAVSARMIACRPSLTHVMSRQEIANSAAELDWAPTFVALPKADRGHRRLHANRIASRLTCFIAAGDGRLPFSNGPTSG